LLLLLLLAVVIAIYMSCIDRCWEARIVLAQDICIEARLLLFAGVTNLS
jgi:hypothetical protein